MSNLNTHPTKGEPIMQLTFTDPATKDKLVLTEFSAELDDSFSHALGKYPSSRRYRCDDEKSKIWPVRFTLTAKGVMDTAKEGRLRVTINGAYYLDKGKGPENKTGFRVLVERESTGQDMGGFVLQDRIGVLVRGKADQLSSQAKGAMVAAVAALKLSEETDSSLCAARARVAGTVIDAIKGK